MTLIKSISGIRGTIGGQPGDNLTPLDAVKFAAAYGRWLQLEYPQPWRVVIGRDARPSGPMIQALVQNCLLGMGIDVIDLGLSTTPTVEMAVPHHRASGGVILTASHNPVEWNALKLLNRDGEFLNAAQGQKILEISEKSDYDFASVQHLGRYTTDRDALERHVAAILALPYVDKEAIARTGFRVAVDGINSSGGEAVPYLLRQLGISEIHEINCKPTGQFAHNPEPLAAHLSEIMEIVKTKDCDLGIVVDPDVDRLAFITDTAQMFGEEYTLVAAADYLLPQKPGPVVSNLSSSRALRDLAARHGAEYHASAVGEVNVVARMKEVNAVLGGEGNGGVILPELHYGRDALAGIALVLSHLALSGQKLSALRQAYPQYAMAKAKIQLEPGMDVDGLLARIKDKYRQEKITDIDGVKIDFAEEWIHLRKSNTEPIIRVYTEARQEERAQALAGEFCRELEQMAAAAQKSEL